MKTYRFENGAFAWMISAKSEEQAVVRFLDITRPNRGQGGSIHLASEGLLSPGIIPSQIGKIRVPVGRIKTRILDDPPRVAEKGFGSPIKKDES
jgi:hypothetical protein